VHSLSSVLIFIRVIYNRFLRVSPPNAQRIRQIVWRNICRQEHKTRENAKQAKAQNTRERKTRESAKHARAQNTWERKTCESAKHARVQNTWERKTKLCFLDRDADWTLGEAHNCHSSSLEDRTKHVLTTYLLHRSALYEMTGMQASACAILRPDPPWINCGGSYNIKYRKPAHTHIRTRSTTTNAQ
jgi:hypothetical protein